MPHPNPMVRAAQAARRKASGKKKARAAGYRRSGKAGMSNLKRMIQSVVKSDQETKYVSDNFDKNSNRGLDPVWDLNSIGAGVLKFLPMIPRLEQGTDSYQRIGDVVQPVGKIATTLQFSYSDTDISGHQIKVEIYYGTSKSRKDWGTQNPLPTDNFLDQGNGTNTNPSTARQSTILPTDKRIVSFRKKVFILSKAFGTTGGDNGTGNDAANGGKSYRTLKLLHTPPKKLKYGVANDRYPENYAPGYYINLSYVDGVQPVTTAAIQSLVKITSRTHMHFKDS